MSSFDPAREKWEEYHTERINSVKKAAENGDPEAGEIMASSIWRIQYNCQKQVMALLSEGSDKGNGRAGRKFASVYASRNEAEYNEKIEFCCRRALAGRRVHSNKNEIDCVAASIAEVL